MDYDELNFWAHKAADWAKEYQSGLRDRPVRPDVQPGDTFAKIAKSPPANAEEIESIFADFVKIIPDGMTHWQHPRFFAYFSSNASPASMLAEQLANAISAQCMLWQTSPAATELETAMVDWLRQAVGLPDLYQGVIQDSATTATLCAVLTMREQALEWLGLEDGLSGQPRMRVYASKEVHSSIDKAIRLAGIGQNNLVKIETDENYSMRPEKLEEAILADRTAGHLPIGVIGCIGGTSIGASDRLRSILSIASQNNLYTHVDAAWAGSAMICPEFREIWDGVELADSIVFNPHKWLGANFDCSIQFLKEPRKQIRTVGIKPAYLETLETSKAIDYSEWTIPLGRRFRALKLWFLVRAYGIDGLQQRIRNHIRWANEAANSIAEIPGLEIVTAPRFSLFTFRLIPDSGNSDKATRALIEEINNDGKIYLTQTNHDGMFVIRLTVGQFNTTESDVQLAVEVIRETARRIMNV